MESQGYSLPSVRDLARSGLAQRPAAVQLHQRARLEGGLGHGTRYDRREDRVCRSGARDADTAAMGREPSPGQSNPWYFDALSVGPSQAHLSSTWCWRPLPQPAAWYLNRRLVKPVAAGCRRQHGRLASGKRPEPIAVRGSCRASDTGGIVQPYVAQAQPGASGSSGIS